MPYLMENETRASVVSDSKTLETQTIRISKENGTTLAANFLKSSSVAVVILCHGFGSDKESRGRFLLLMNRLHDAGLSSLAFDFSGCGESSDAILDLDAEIDDLQTVIAYLRKEGFSQIALYGHSLGSLICLKAFSPAVAAIALSGALTGPMHYTWSDYYSAEQLKELEESGSFLQPVETKGRAAIRIGREMLDAFSLIDQKSLLGNSTLPV
jgi:pimeloyl-ACP methyl ester carboxylesterase